MLQRTTPGSSRRSAFLEPRMRYIDTYIASIREGWHNNASSLGT